MADSLYGEKYAKTWIKHHESGDDEFRTKYMQPYFKERLASASGSILDVGCGWGGVLEFLCPDVRYTGVDVAPEFFDYIKDKYSQKFGSLQLQEGGLPDCLDVGDSYDMTICSMVLHTVSDLHASITSLYRTVRLGGQLLVITFNDDSRQYLTDAFKRVDERTERHIKGTFELPSKTLVNTAIYFHGEKRYEDEVSLYGRYTKREIGPLFVAYECTKS